MKIKFMECHEILVSYSVVVVKRGFYTTTPYVSRQMLRIWLQTSGE